ncbi:eukaryotic translation initiation factor 4B1-like [Wolffia australiana]
MSTTKPWGRIGAWAADAEAAEAEEQAAAAAAAVAAAPPAVADSFPSLKEAASSKPKKKKPSTMSLSAFYSSSSATSRGLTPDELLRLPTGPRERSQDELESSRGFRSYGLGGGGSGGMSARRDDGGRRGFGGGFDDDAPRRADEVDNWGSMKKPLAREPGGDRYEALGGRAAPSRADETDNWAAGKKPLPPARPSAALDSSDRWVRGPPPPPPPTSSIPPNGERPRLVLEPRKADVGETGARTAKPSPFGAARPREQVLAEKGMDWRRMEAEIEVKKVARPTSSQSSRPSSAQSSRTQSPVRQLGAGEQGSKPRQKVNPFGDAKPREVVLQEQGKDWKKIEFELEHRAVHRPDTEEEKKMKEEIKLLNELLYKDGASNETGEHDRFSPEDLDNLRQKKESLEHELEQLARELDDKVRFGQKTGDRRPGSASGRPSSQSGISEDSRSVDFVERPRSRGGGADTWSRSGDDRRSYNLGNRISDRPLSRERW